MRSLNEEHMSAKEEYSEMQKAIVAEIIGIAGEFDFHFVIWGWTTKNLLERDLNQRPSD